MPACTASPLPIPPVRCPERTGGFSRPPHGTHPLRHPNPHPQDHPTFWLPEPTQTWPCDESSSSGAKGSPELGGGGMDVTRGHRLCPHGCAPVSTAAISLSRTAPAAAPKLMVTSTFFKKSPNSQAPAPQDLLICKSPTWSSAPGTPGDSATRVVPVMPVVGRKAPLAHPQGEQF